MSDIVRVEKIGGDDSFRMGATLNLLRERGAEKGVYIFSAFKNSIKGQEFNTTSTLETIGKDITTGDYPKAFEGLGRLQAFYISVIEREFSNDEKMRLDLEAYCIEQFAAVKTFIHQHRQNREAQGEENISADLPSEANDYSVIFGQERVSLLGLGEILTTKLFQRALLGSSTLDVADVGGEEDAKSGVRVIYEKVANNVHSLLETSNTVLVPGYVGLIPDGILKEFGRGYSDASASHIYQQLSKNFPHEHFELAIKKLFVICSADPRIAGVDNVRVIRTLSLRLLLEMIGARGACGPFVNRNAVSPALFRNDGFIRLYSETDPEGSVITLNGDSESEGVLFVQSKPVSVITIVSYHMNQEGYIERVGDFFRNYHISIDNIVSSETSITLTINEKDLKGKDINTVVSELRDNLGELEKEGEEGDVEVQYAPISEIYVGGESIDSPGLMMQISTILAEHSINIATNMQPMNPRVVIIGVSRDSEQEAVKALHERLLERD